MNRVSLRRGFYLSKVFCEAARSARSCAATTARAASLRAATRPRSLLSLPTRRTSAKSPRSRESRALATSSSAIATAETNRLDTIPYRTIVRALTAFTAMELRITSILCCSSFEVKQSRELTLITAETQFENVHIHPLSLRLSLFQLVNTVNFLPVFTERGPLKQRASFCLSSLLLVSWVTLTNLHPDTGNPKFSSFEDNAIPKRINCILSQTIAVINY